MLKMSSPLDDEQQQFSTVDSLNNDSNWTIQMFFIGSFAVLSGAINLTVIAVILLSSRLRRSPHLYVANVLLLALVRALASLPLRMMILSRASEKDFSYQELDFLCKLFSFTSILSQFGIVYAFVVTSLDRYLTVIHGRLGVQRCSGLLIYFPIMLCVWGLAFVTALLEVYGHADDHDNNVRECRKSSGNIPSALSSITWLFLFVFSFCCVSSNLFYLRIYFFMRHYRRMRPYLEAPQINDGWTDPRMIVATAATSGGLRWPLPMMSSVPNPTRSLNLQTPPPKRALVGVCALLNFISVFLWLPSLISTFRHLSSLSSSSAVHVVNGYHQFLFSKVKSVTDDDDDDVGVVGGSIIDGHVLFVVGIVTSWLELVHILIVPVFYVCTCSVFRKEVLKIRSSSE